MKGREFCKLQTVVIMNKYNVLSESWLIEKWYMCMMATLTSFLSPFCCPTRSSYTCGHTWLILLCDYEV